MTEVYEMQTSYTLDFTGMAILIQYSLILLFLQDMKWHQIYKMRDWQSLHTKVFMHVTAHNTGTCFQKKTLDIIF